MKLRGAARLHRAASPGATGWASQRLDASKRLSHRATESPANEAAETASRSCGIKVGAGDTAATAGRRRNAVKEATNARPTERQRRTEAHRGQDAASTRDRSLPSQTKGKRKRKWHDAGSILETANARESGSRNRGYRRHGGGRDYKSRRWRHGGQCKRRSGQTRHELTRPNAGVTGAERSGASALTQMLGME